MTDKHTPGPWEMPAGPADKNISDIFDVGDYNVYPPLGEAGPVAIVAGEANAHLIAAAPAMLTMLRELRECAEYWSEYDVPLGIVERLDSVIKQAAGETN